MGRVYTGEAVSKGIAIGPLYQYRPVIYRAEPAQSTDAAAEASRLEEALARADQELTAIMEGFGPDQQDKAMIFAAHQELLQDEELLDTIRMGLDEEHYTVEYAVQAAFEEFIGLLSQVEDPTIAARTADLKDVRNRLLRILAGAEERNLSRLPGPVIIAAHDLLPSDTATLDRQHVLGILTEVGGGTSHSAIIARSMHIPAVLGVKDALNLTRDGEQVILDALKGEVLCEPEPAVIEDYRRQETGLAARRQKTAAYLAAEGATRDGVSIAIGLNIGSAAADEHYGYVDYVGLFRTEFLYMENDHMPTEEEQYRAYRRVLEQAGDKWVTLRTLDIGGDKQLPYFDLPKEDNPFLGCRALRLCLARKDLFRTQLRAAYRASAHGKLQLMFPMVGSLDDIRRAKETALSVRKELEEAGVPVGQVPLGIMIEIPAIAMIADLAAEEVEFASIGTNDLCQYLCAADRMNAAVAPYSQSMGPAMLRTLKRIIDAFRTAGKPLSVCGEMSGDPAAAALLVGMGLRKLSMSGSAIADIKEMLASHTLEQLEETAEKALSCRTQKEVLGLTEALLSE